MRKKMQISTQKGHVMKKKSEPSVNNIWDKEGFQMCGLGEKSKIIARIKHFRRCVLWSRQRIVRGYADCDRRHMDRYLQNLIPDMLQDLRDNRYGSPSYLGENYTNENGILVNDTCHKEWDKILDRMIFLWRESNEYTCRRKNPYEEEHSKAYSEFAEKYGFFGEKLQTEEELERKRKHGSTIVHFMGELPEYKEISDRHFEEERKLDEYRKTSKDEALDLLKEHFWALWD